MADRRRITGSGEPHHQLSGRTVLYATFAGVALGGPLLGLMGLSFLATFTLFVVSSPLLLLFSPVLIGAAIIFIAAVAAISAALVMAVAGLAGFGWGFRQFRAGRPIGLVTSVLDELEEGKDWAGYLQQKAHNPDQEQNRG